MPAPVRFAALLASVLWAWMLHVAPASAPLYHPAGLLDLACVVSFCFVGPLMGLVALLPNRFWMEV